MKGWIGFDLDGTLAEYDGWKGAGHIGAPIPAMVARLKDHLANGDECRIFTARAWHPLMNLDVVFDENTFQFKERTDAENVEVMARCLEAQSAVKAIRNWCTLHIGKILPITCTKDYGMVLLYDDRCKQVEINTGRIVGEQ